MAYTHLANEGANANNLVVVKQGKTGCCTGLNLQICTYTATVTTSNLPGTILTYKDPKDLTTNKTIVLATGTTPATIVAELRRVLPLIGYTSDGLNLPDVSATVVTTTTVIVIKTDGVPVSITATGGAVAFVQSACQAQ